MFRKVTSTLAMILALVMLIAFSGTSIAPVAAASQPLALSSDSAPSQVADDLIKGVFIAPNGGWVVLHGKNGYTTSQVPKDLNAKLKELNKDDSEIESVAFTSDMGFVVIFDGNGFFGKDVPKAVLTRLKELNTDKVDVKQVEFHKGDSDVEEWIILHGGNAADWSDGFNAKAIEELKSLNEANEEFKWVTAQDDGSWVVFYGKNAYVYSKGLPKDFVDQIKKLNDDAVDIMTASISEDGEQWIVVSDKTVAFNGIPDDLNQELKERLGG